MAARKKKRSAASPTTQRAELYTHSSAEVSSRPEIGTQAQFRRKKAPKTYTFDSSLSPGLDWDGQNHAREHGEALIQRILSAKSLEDAQSAAEELARISKPFLNWSGKAERLSFDVPTHRIRVRGTSFSRRKAMIRSTTLKRPQRTGGAPR